MTIGKKLYYGFGAILALLVVLVIVNSLVMLRERSARSDAEVALENVRTIEALRFQMMQNRLYLDNFLLSGDRREEEKLNAGISELNSLVRKAQEMAGAENARSSLVQTEQYERDWLDHFCKPLVEKRHDVDNGDLSVQDFSLSYLQHDPNQYVQKSATSLDEASAAIRKAQDESSISTARAARFITVVSTIGTLLTILLGLGIAYYTAQSIVQPLDHLIAVSREIGDSGDLNQNIDLERKDEIGALAKTFNSMVTYLKEMSAVSAAVAEGDLAVEIAPRSERDTLAHAFSRMAQGLQDLVRRVRESASQVAAGSNEVAGASDDSAKVSVQAASAIDEVTSTMHEMSINVQNVVKNTQFQVSSVAQTSASIDQMVASIQRVADTSRALLDISQRSREEVKTGLASMEKTTQGLNKTNKVIQTSAEMISALGQRADDIGKIIEVIDDLAEQTNLLALNAAIEAARAGEHGLGFAVVADEVRKLAEKSTQSTKEIAELIGSIQKEAREAVKNMADSTKIVEEGLILGSELNTALEKISHVVTEVYKFAQEIGAATNEQANGSSQISKATTRLNEISQEISSSVEEQASGVQAVVRAMEKMRELVQQSSSGATELAAAAEQMTKMSRTLLETMDRFELDAHQNGEGHNGKGRSAHGPKRESENGRRATEYAEMARS
jgi:methyl-accepting chemotaxis protein